MAPDFDPNAPTMPDPSSGTRPSTSVPSLAGRRIGDYQVVREIGKGGMGVVYLAHDEALQRDVAIKVLQPSLASDPEFEKRFIREARTSAKLEHPNVVPVYTAGRDGELLYMAMAFVKGRTLDALLKEKGKLPVAEAVDIIRQACRGLGAAHAASLVHRDIKPHNIMLDEAGRVRIMDFGLMRSWTGEREAITETGVFYGTPAYASPEQCDGGELDGRADLYSLGAVFYEMLTGKRPHTGDTPVALFKKILLEKPTTVRELNPDVPAGVAAVVEKMMAKRADERFATADAVIAALDSPAPVSTSRRGALWAAFGAAALLLAAAAVMLNGPEGVEKPPPDGRTKLVVFDLQNGIPKPESAWYSIALSDLLIAALSKRPALDVPPRDTLLFTLKKMELSGKAEGDERAVLTDRLGARAYLSGSYYAQGKRIRLTLAGFKLPENTPLFPALTVERPEDDLFGLADQAAAEIAKALLGEEPPSLAKAAGEELKRVEPEVEGRRLPTSAAPAPPPAPALRVRQSEKPQANLSEKADAKAQDLPASVWAHAWYENRRALEGHKLKKEDFEAAASALAREFRKRAPEQAALAGDGSKDKDRPGPAIEFVCPGCKEVRPAFERCEPCERFPLVRLKR